MREWKPVTERYASVVREGALHEGIPVWLRQPLRDWLLRNFGEWNRSTTWLKKEVLQLVAMNLQLELDWGYDEVSATRSLLEFMEDDADIGIEALNFIVSRFLQDSTESGGLEFLLRESGSKSRLGQSEAGFRLEQRVEDEVHTRFVKVASEGVPGEHLRAAWDAMYGVDPNYDVAYDRAIKAIEASAKPVVSPENEQTTLGTIIRDFRAKPAKWRVALGGEDFGTGHDATIAMMQAVWKGHLARHGTDDPDAQTEMGRFETEAALHTAITLVHLFSSGFVSPVIEDG